MVLDVPDNKCVFAPYRIPSRSARLTVSECYRCRLGGGPSRPEQGTRPQETRKI